MNKKIELKPCPFCSGEAEIHHQPIYTDIGVCIRCTECKARSKFFPCDCNYIYYHGERDVYISKERATSDAINMWNSRANEKQSEGEWIEEYREWDMHPFYYIDYTCSICGQREQNKSPYCRWCGAKMKGGE